jgi:hypothetical protein
MPGRFIGMRRYGRGRIGSMRRCWPVTNWLVGVYGEWPPVV